MASCLSSVQADSASIYVSTTGNDDHSGTLKQPLATLEEARDRIRKLRKSKDKTYTVNLSSGNYYFDKTVRFDEQDSGVVYKASPGEKPTIYGGKPISGWKKWQGDIYRAPVPKGTRFFRLFENGRSAVMASNPNSGSGYGGGLKKVNNTTIKVPQEWKDYDFSNAQVYGWLGADWFAELRKVNSFDKMKLQLKIDPGSKNFQGLNNRVMIQGVPELLDQEGEWCLRPEEGYVYYWPRCAREGLAIHDQLIVAPSVSRILDIRGSSRDKIVHDIVFEGITFIGSDFTDNWRVFTEREGSDSMPDGLQEGMIYIENADRIEVKYCKLMGAGHSAVYVNRRSQNCSVYGSWIEDAGFCGIYLGSYAPLRGPIKGGLESYINKGHTISNNYIYDCGKFIGGGCGVQIYQSGDNKITHNRIAKMPRYGISYKGTRYGKLLPELKQTDASLEAFYKVIHSRNNVISYNDISNVCRDSFDFGAIEAWGGGRDNVWEYNAIHDVDQSVNWKGWAHGLFPDDGSNFLKIKGNIVYELNGGHMTGAIMVKSISGDVQNNVFADNQIGRGVSMDAWWGPVTDNLVRRNIFSNTGRELYAINKALIENETYAGKGPNEHVKAYVKGRPPFQEVDQNLVWPDEALLDQSKSLGWSKKSIVADPLFDKKNPQWDVTYRDYQLKKNSPAFKLGYKAIDMEPIGLRQDFPFDRSDFFLKVADQGIQAEDYDRMRDLRAKGNTGINSMKPGAWAKYANVDFGDEGLGRVHITAKYEGTPKGASVKKKFSTKRYDGVNITSRSMVNSNSETIPVWEVSPIYRSNGKVGEALLDASFPPENNLSDIAWTPFLEPTTSRSGMKSKPGVVDIDVFHGGDNKESCAYLRSSVYLERGRTNTDLKLTCTTGAKLWLNGKLIFTGVQKKDQRIMVTLKKGWNTFVMKVVQGTGNNREFKAKLAMKTKACGSVQAIPGLPAEQFEIAKESDARQVFELRLESPKGKLIGTVNEGDTSVPVIPTKGRHNLFLVFKSSCELDAIRFTKRKGLQP